MIYQYLLWNMPVAAAVLPFDRIQDGRRRSSAPTDAAISGGTRIATRSTAEPFAR